MSWCLSPPSFSNLPLTPAWAAAWAPSGSRLPKRRGQGKPAQGNQSGNNGKRPTVTLPTYPLASRSHHHSVEENTGRLCLTCLAILGPNDICPNAKCQYLNKC